MAVNYYEEMFGKLMKEERGTVLDTKNSGRNTTIIDGLNEEE